MQPAQEVCGGEVDGIARANRRVSDGRAGNIISSHCGDVVIHALAAILPTTCLSTCSQEPEGWLSVEEPRGMKFSTATQPRDGFVS
jgi:hypothetical protein